MKINILSENNNTIANFPLTEPEIQQLCDELQIENNAFTKIKINQPDELFATLENKEIVLDELNFLTKILDSFNSFEKNIYLAAADGFNFTTTKDLLNLVFNMDCYTVVDHSCEDQNQLGKLLFMNEHVGMPLDEYEGFDGVQYINDFTELNPLECKSKYGDVYFNSNDPITVFNGKNIPCLGFDDREFVICASVDDKKEYLYLPLRENELNKALQRLDVDDLRYLKIEFEAHDLSEDEFDEIKDEKDLEKLNDFAKKLADEQETQDFGMQMA
ncbi:MAG: hypothetical protein R3Y09_07770 [Clostridia bacterium]